MKHHLYMSMKIDLIKKKIELSAILLHRISVFL